MTVINEIGEGIYRISTPVRELPGGFSFNQILVDERRAAPLPHRWAQAVPGRQSGDHPRHAARSSEMDWFFPRRGGRVRSDAFHVGGARRVGERSPAR